MERFVTLLSFEGRLSRLQFWKDYLFLAVVGAVDVVIGLFAVMWLQAWGAILLTPLIAVIIASLAIVVRRLHDRNKSVLWILPFGVFPLMVQLWMLGEAQQTAADIVLIVALASLILNIWGFVEIGLRRGVAGPNKYGDDPQPS